MKLSNLLMIALLAGALGAFGCSDDPATGNGGNGTGGNGGDPFDPALCNRELCVNNETLRQACETALEACRLVPDLQQDECIGLALAPCLE